MSSEIQEAVGEGLDEGSGLVAQADAEEDSFRFHDAYRLFLQAADFYDHQGDGDSACLAWMRAAICLEKTEKWRAHAAIWNTLGDRLCDLASGENVFPKRDSPGQMGLFYVKSWRDWQNPEQGYYRHDDASRRSHQQVWAYLWAAEGAERIKDAGHAAYLYRKAAVAWELSGWGDRPPKDADESWSAERLADIYGEKWHQAAQTYFRAARAEIASSGVLSPAYEPQHSLSWKKTQGQTSNSVWDTNTDIERMMRCGYEYGRARASVYLQKGDVKQARQAELDAMKFVCHHLLIIQDRLARAGSRKDAARIHRIRHQVLLQYAWRKRPLTSILQGVNSIATGNGSSLTRTVVALSVLYAVIFPMIYAYGGLLNQGDDSGTPISFLDALTFSIGAAFSTEITDIHAVSGFGQAIAIAEAASAYFALAFSVWILFRTYEIG